MKALVEPLKRLPLLKISLAFGLGIYIQHLVDCPLLILVACALIGAAVALCGWISRIYALRWLFGVGFLLFIFAAGAGYYAYSSRSSINIESAKTVGGWLTVEENPIATRYGCRWRALLVKADSLYNSMMPVGCIVYSKSRQIPRVGDVVYARVRISPIQAPKNPFEFDYRAYYAAQQLYAQASIDSVGYVTVGECYINPIRRMSCAIQRYVLTTFVSSGLKGNDLGVVTALLIGDKQFLDKETKTTYANIGAMHLLAVSGMHVGIIYEVLIALLFFMKGRRAHVYRNLIAIVVLWIYAVVAGLAPSILRATFMFSVLGLGNIIGRDKNTFNMLATAFFFQLVINPLALFNLGMQLSYAAVASILLFYPVFRQWAPRKILYRKVYDMVAVTLAAQILTLPICIYNFHQFPLVFIATNLVLLPITTVIMYAGIALLAFAAIPVVAKSIAFVTHVLCSAANKSADFLAQIPFSSMKNIDIGEWQMLLLVVASLLLYVFLLHPTFKTLLLPLLLVFVVAAGSLEDRLRVGSPHIVAYSSPNKLAVLLKDGTGCYCLCDSVRPVGEYGFMEESVRRWMRMPLDSVRFVDLSHKLDVASASLSEGWVSFGGKSMYVATRYFPAARLAGNPITVDYLLVAKGAGNRPEYAFRVLDPNMVVLTSSMSNWQRTKWIEYCSANNISYFDVRDQGAWVVSL